MWTCSDCRHKPVCMTWMHRHSVCEDYSKLQ